MKLVQSLFLPQQATLRKYYALVTGIDCNPYNGPEAKATYDTIISILSERASLNEQICIRIYDNEPGFGLSRYNHLDDDVEIQVLLIAMDDNNNGWELKRLKEAFKTAKVPSIMREEIGAYSFNWYSPTGVPTFQLYMKDTAPSTADSIFTGWKNTTDVTCTFPVNPLSITPLAELMTTGSLPKITP